jgi:glycosyltransferase involved in cell wall biosynthesis
MNIILFSHTFLPKVGGRELVVHYLAKALNELGHNVRVFGPDGWLSSRNFEFDYPVNRYPRFVRLRAGKNEFVSQLCVNESYYKLLFDISKFGCDIIHAHTTYPAGYVSSLVKRKYPRIKLMVTPHGVDIHKIPHLGHGMRLNPVLEPKINQALEVADCVTSISEGMEKSILESCANKNKVYRVPNGVDLDRFSHTTKFDIYKHFDINPDAKLIITVGNYHLRKGHEVILKAIPIIKKSEPNVHLLIVGENTGALNKYIQEHNISDNVTLTGSIPFSINASTIISNGKFQKGYDILAALYESSLLYVSAGTEHGSEGLSLAILEAMASGLPIVASKISGNVDIVKDDYNGYLVEPSSHIELAEKITYLLKHEEKRISISRNARETVSEYDWKEIAKKYIEIYKIISTTGD